MVFDTVALDRALAHLGSGSLVVALAFWPGDTAWHEEYGARPDSMAIIETTFPDSLRGPIRAALLDAVQRPVAARLLIRLDLNDHQRLRLAPALECPPAVRTQADLRRYTTALQSFRAPPGRAMLQFLVRPDGALTAFQIRISSGDPDLDRAALSVVPLLRFTPGLINHVPVPSLVRFPVEVRGTRQAPPPPPTSSDCPQGRVVEITNPLSEAVAVYAFSPVGAHLLGTVSAARTVRLALPSTSTGNGFVHWADSAAHTAQVGDLRKVRWTVKCGLP
jgi:TonB family protein